MAQGDPYWTKARFKGKDSEGRPVKPGDKILYFPRGRSVMTGPEADKAWADFTAAAQDEAFANGGSW